MRACANGAAFTLLNTLETRTCPGAMVPAVTRRPARMGMRVPRDEGAHDDEEFAEGGMDFTNDFVVGRLRRLMDEGG